MKILAWCAAACLPLLALDAGTARVDITPTTGAPLAGYYYNRAATGTHDALHAKALVLVENGVKLALVTCDLSAMPDSIAAVAREHIQKATGIPASHVMISATHTHTAPVILSGFSRYQLEGEMLRIAEAYAQVLPERIARSVIEANQALKPARLYSANGEEASLPFNRRFHMKSGPVAWNPGKTTNDILRPAGPIDPAIPILYVETFDGEPLAAYINYAIHLDTVGGTEFSADFVQTLELSLRAAKSPRLNVLFTMGCAGNINHLNTSWKAAQKGHTEAARIGTVLAAAVLKALVRMEPVENLRFEANAILEPLPKVEPDVVYPGHTSDFLKQVTAARAAELRSDPRPTRNAEVQMLRLNADHAIIGLPGEIFVELGLRLKLGAPTRWLAIATQANGNIGYVPDARAYAQGNYEVVSTRVKAGSGERLIDTALQFLRGDLR